MKFIKSIYKSVKTALYTNEDIQKLKIKYPHTTYFLKNRIDQTKFTGLPLTILSIIFIYVFLLFVGAIESFITTEVITSVDFRVNALFYTFRNNILVNLFTWITLLGESITVIIFTMLVSLFLWLNHKRWKIVTIWFIVICSGGFTFIAKLFFQRPRPTNAVFLETSNSFPSGHATISIAFYGFLTYLAVRKLKKKKYQILSILIGILLITLIGLSRLYLGVHYVSDVWTGYLIGLMCLIIGITITEWNIFSSKTTLEEKKILKNYKKIIIIGLFSVASIFYIVYGLSHKPEFIPKTSNIFEFK